MIDLILQEILYYCVSIILISITIFLVGSLFIILKKIWNLGDE